MEHQEVNQSLVVYCPLWTVIQCNYVGWLYHPLVSSSLVNVGTELVAAFCSNSSTVAGLSHSW